jgi:hypothetical protein
MKFFIFHGYVVATAPPGFQEGWSDLIFYFSLSWFVLFAHLEFPSIFLYL